MNLYFQSINFLPSDVPELISATRRLELMMRGAGSSSYRYGINRCRYGLLSQDIADKRHYVSGDEPRHIDWRLFARTDRYFVNVYQNESTRNILVSLDTSQSMRYKGSSNFSKLDYARRIATILAALAIRRNSKVALLTSNNTLIPYSSSKGHFFKILMHLFSHSIEQEQSSYDIVDFLGILTTKNLKSHSVFVISDCFSKQSDFKKALRQLAAINVDVAICQILAEEELTFPFEGQLLLQDMENADLCIGANASEVKNKYILNVRSFLKTLAEQCHQSKTEYMIFKTSLPLLPQISKFLFERKNFKRSRLQEYLSD